MWDPPYPSLAPLLNYLPLRLPSLQSHSIPCIPLAEIAGSILQRVEIEIHVLFIPLNSWIVRLGSLSPSHALEVTSPAGLALEGPSHPALSHTDFIFLHSDKEQLMRHEENLPLCLLGIQQWDPVPHPKASTRDKQQHSQPGSLIVIIGFDV